MMSMVASFLPTLSLIHAHPAVQGLISYDGRRFPDDQNLWAVSEGVHIENNLVKKYENTEEELLRSCNVWLN